jgi:hypothetical protein
LEEIMTTFRGNRVVHEFTQTNPAAPEKVFPLLCPVREGDWLRIPDEADQRSGVMSITIPG